MPVAQPLVSIGPHSLQADYINACAAAVQATIPWIDTAQHLARRNYVLSGDGRNRSIVPPQSGLGSFLMRILRHGTSDKGPGCRRIRRHRRFERDYVAEAQVEGCADRLQRPELRPAAPIAHVIERLAGDVGSLSELPASPSPDDASSLNLLQVDDP